MSKGIEEPISSAYCFPSNVSPVIVCISEVYVDEEFGRGEFLSMDIRDALSEFVALLARQRSDVLYIIPWHVRSP